MVCVLGGVVCVGYAQSRVVFGLRPNRVEARFFWSLEATPNRVEARFFYPISTPPELCEGNSLVPAPHTAGVCVGGK